MPLNIDYDLDRWLYIPNRFPWESFANEESWADTIAKEYRRVAVRKPPRELIQWFRDYLVGAVRSNQDGTIRFLHLANLGDVPALLDVYDLPTHPDRPMSELTHENQGPAIKPAELEPFESPHLGMGIKSTRWVTNDRGTVIRATNWVWRTQGRDIVVLTGSSNLPVAETLQPFMDEFARAVSIAE